ncbi:uncharacterized protein G2W53_032406 [Senna tora]|uniref:Uncharacterized protein n=1 Tax=Senna tora TaxID=362788 RepID=A0A834W6A1_9FABA|nr:uncharacterized protein G2W53_032406 [Senna tora]
MGQASSFTKQWPLGCHRRSRATVAAGGHRRSGLPVIEAAVLPFAFRSSALIQLREQSGEVEAEGGEFGRLRGIRRTLTAKSTETAFPRARLEQIREERGLVERGRGKGHIGHSLVPAFIHHCSTLECSIPFPSLLCLTNTVFELSLLFSFAFST